jgi:glycosyltransferase involved in cell wall biosynthesis
VALKIGVVHWSFPPVTGGVEMHLLTITPEMVRQGARVYVLCGTAENAPAEEVVHGVTVFRREILGVSHLQRQRDTGQPIYQPARDLFDTFLSDHDIDVVQAHNLHYDFYPLSRALRDASTEREIPAYLVIHSDVFIDRSQARTARILKEIGWDRLVPISDYLLGSLRSTLSDIPEDAWTVIKHGIDTERFKSVDDAGRKRLRREYGLEGRKVILHTGRFLPWKGILPALRSMPSIREEIPDALMVLTGRATRLYKDQEQLAQYDAQIDRYIEEQDLSEHVQIGDYDHDDIPRLNALSDVVIYTTIGQEPFGLVPVEGMACGVPVIVTDSGGLVESVVDGETGFVITRDEKKLSRELAKRTIQLLEDPDLAERFGKRGRERVEGRFDKRRMADDFIRLSRELLDEVAL